MVVWIIGLSGSGKTVIGKQLTRKIREIGRPAVFMDGDIFRDIMGNDLGHSIDDRKRNADRICKFCDYFDKQGIDVIFAILSIFHESQEWNRENIKDYFEIYLEVSTDTVKRRDSKGLYNKALRGEINNVVGIDILFKPPKNPDLIINNDNDDGNFDSIVQKILNAMKSAEIIQKC